MGDLGYGAASGTVLDLLWFLQVLYTVQTSFESGKYYTVRKAGHS